MVGEFDHPVAFNSWGDEEAAAMRRVIDSGHFTIGEETARFESEFAEYHGRRYAVACNSGSSANWLAVQALLPFDEPNPTTITAPAIAWATTYSPFVMKGIDLRIADVDDTWNCPEGDIFVRCPVLGNPANSSSCVIEDCCESIGARTAAGQLVGTFGKMATFSGFYSHQISAVELGIVLTDDDYLARLCRLLRNHGLSRSVEEPESFDHEYDFLIPAMNLRPIEMHCAIAREQLYKLDSSIVERQKNHSAWLEATSRLPIENQRMVGSPNPFGFSFCVADSDVRRRLAIALRANGIDCRLPTGGSFTSHPFGRKYREANPTPNADRIHQCGLFLGNAP